MEDNAEKRKLSFWMKVLSSVKGIKHYENVLKETTGKAVIISAINIVTSWSYWSYNRSY